MAVNGGSMDLVSLTVESCVYPESRQIDFSIGIFTLKGIANIDGSYTEEKGHLSE